MKCKNFVIPASEPESSHNLQKDYAFTLRHPKGWLIGANPFLIFKSKGDKIWIRRDNEPLRTYSSPDPLRELQELFSQYQTPYSPEPFFQGGLVGYFGYDLARSLEKLPTKCREEEDIPDILVGFYEPEKVHDCPSLNSLPENEPFLESFFKTGNLQCNFEKDQYLTAIAHALNYIAQGDIYQVNLSQKFRARFEGDPYQLFRKLIQKYPAPFAAYFHTPDLSLISLSPERFLRIEDRMAETHPIKGTRPRGSTPAEDLALRNELIQSSKDAAELLMIIDLERNDLGKVCEYGSVLVSNPKRFETHPTVFHLVGQVEGKLKKEASHFDCLRALFPGGSITGAPKIRAMEIIEELEPTRRNIYTGVFGYMGFNGVTDLSILIRTLVHKNGQISFQLGSGIVADSMPQAEYEETLVKGKAFFEVLSSRGPRRTSESATML